jgi:hypothetical protein
MYYTRSSNGWTTCPALAQAPPRAVFRGESPALCPIAWSSPPDRTETRSVPATLSSTCSTTRSGSPSAAPGRVGSSSGHPHRPRHGRGDYPGATIAGLPAFHRGGFVHHAGARRRGAGGWRSADSWWDWTPHRGRARWVRVVLFGTPAPANPSPTSRSCRCGDDAPRMVEDRRFDLVLMDYDARAGRLRDNRRNSSEGRRRLAYADRRHGGQRDAGRDRERCLAAGMDDDRCRGRPLLIGGPRFAPTSP